MKKTEILKRYKSDPVTYEILRGIERNDLYRVPQYDNAILQVTHFYEKGIRVKSLTKGDPPQLRRKRILTIAYGTLHKLTLNKVDSIVLLGELHNGSELYPDYFR